MDETLTRMCDACRTPLEGKRASWVTVVNRRNVSEPFYYCPKCAAVRDRVVAFWDAAKEWEERCRVRRYKQR